MNYKKVTALLLVSCLTAALTACGQTAASGTGSDSVSAVSDDAADVADLVDRSDMFTERDLSGEYDATAIAVTLSDSGSTCDSENVTISDQTITITGEGTYLLSGTLSCGQIIIDAKGEKVQLVLDGASISNSTSAALYVRQADKVFLTLADGSDNFLSTTEEFAAIDDNNIDAAIFSKSDLTLNGSGSLTVECTNGHGIVSKDDLRITGGNYTITAGRHAISGKDSVRVSGGSFALTSGTDGIHSENTDDTEKGFIYIADGNFTIDSTGDGIDASSVVQIDGGSFAITSGGGSANAPAHTGNDDWMMMGGGQKGFGGGAGASGSFGDPATNGAEASDGSAASDSTETGMPQDFGTGEAPQMPDTDGSMQAPDTDGNMQAPDTDGNMQAPGTDGNMQAPDADGNMQAPDTAPSDTTGTTDSDSTDSSISCKGIKADGAMKLSGLTLTADTADDSVHAGGAIYIMSGNYTIATGDDGVHSDSDLTVYDCSMDISTSYEGLEGLTITTYGGTISLVASDDGLNAAGGNDASGFGFGGGSMDYSAANQIVINGGTLSINAGGDGIDSNGDFTMNGGFVTVDGPVTSGDAPLDWGGSGIVNGGTLIAVGSSGMAESFSSDGTQGVMLVTLSSSQTGDVALSDADGNSLLTYTPAKSYNCVIFSCAEILSDSTYTVTAGTDTETIAMDGLVYGSGSGMDGMGGGSGMGGGKNFGDRGGKNMPDHSEGDTQMPDGSAPSGDGQMPDGSAPSGDGQMPDGTTSSDSGQLPDA